MPKVKTVNGFNAGDLNLLKGDIRKAIRALEANRKPAAMMIADEAVELAKAYLPPSAFTDLDGNKIDTIYARETEFGATATMTSLHKYDSQYPDAFYIEYGYGSKGADHHPAPPPDGYDYYGLRERGKDDYWFYYDLYNGGKVTRSRYRGFAGLAPMYSSRVEIRKQLNDPASSLRARLREEFGLDDAFGGA